MTVLLEYIDLGEKGESLTTTALLEKYKSFISGKALALLITPTLIPETLGVDILGIRF